MSVDALAAPLLRVALFQGLSSAQLTEIGRRAERIVFKDRDLITVEGVEGDAAFLIASGSAEIVNSDEAGDMTRAVEAGSLAGEMAMLIEVEYAATVRACGTVRALKITRAQMHAMMLRDPSLAECLTERITERLFVAAEELRRVDALLSATSHWSDGSDETDGRYVPVTMGSDRALPAPLTH
jgi:CRP-like cAMP-binding protein